MKKYKKVIVLGSGALKIGEAGEFDYSGSQAIKALKEEGIKIILVNPNIATIQTSKELAEQLNKIHISTPRSQAATTLKDASKIAKRIGFPVMIRAGYTLGGQGSGIAKNAKELNAIVQRALAFAPQVLIERYLHHYKEI